MRFFGLLGSIFATRAESSPRANNDRSDFDEFRTSLPLLSGFAFLMKRTMTIIFPYFLGQGFFWFSIPTFFMEVDKIKTTCDVLILKLVTFSIFTSFFAGIFS